MLVHVLLPAYHKEAIAAPILSTGCGKRRHGVLPASFYARFCISSLFYSTEREIRAGKLLIDRGHLNPFLFIKKSGLDILLTGYNNLTLQTY
jgi:hypothetical protein